MTPSCAASTRRRSTASGTPDIVRLTRIYHAPETPARPASGTTASAPSSIVAWRPTRMRKGERLRRYRVGNCRARCGRRHGPGACAERPLRYRADLATPMPLVLSTPVYESTLPTSSGLSNGATTSMTPADAADVHPQWWHARSRASHVARRLPGVRSAPLGPPTANRPS